jgi:hypothetical protein
MHSSVANIVRHIHNHGAKQLVLYCTGAGSSSMSWLLGVSGASRTILETYAYQFSL